MKRFLSTLLTIAAAGSFAMNAQTQATIAEMVAANPNLSQGQLSSDTYTIVTKNIYTGAVVNTQVTVVAVSPDLMFVRDSSNRLIAVERPISKPDFTTFYTSGNKIDNLVVRYKANFVARGTDLLPVPYSVFEGEEYTKTAQTLNITYSQCYLQSAVNSTDYSVAKVGKNTDNMNELMLATWNPTTQEFDYEYVYNNRTYTIHIKAGKMGIDCSSFQPVTCSIYAQGVVQPTDNGFDLYPTAVRQDLPKTINSIAEGIAEAKNITHNGESFNYYRLNSKLKINALSTNKCFIEDSTGAISLQRKNSSLDFTASGLKAGDIINELDSVYLYYDTRYGENLYMIFAGNEMPKANSHEDVNYTAQTPESLRQNSASLNCRPVKLENVRVKSNGQFEGISVNPSDFLPGYGFDNRKIYTITAIYQNLNSGSLSVTSAQETGNATLQTPIDIATLEEFVEKGANLKASEITEEIYRIKEKVTVVKKGNYMFIQSPTTAIPVSALATSTISSAPYESGNIVENLELRVQYSSYVLQGYFDIDESEWPEKIEGAVGLPEIVAFEDLDPSYAYRWISLKGVKAAAKTNFKHDNLHINTSTAAATVACNTNLGAPAISFVTNNLYDLTGVLYARRSATAVTQWQFYTASWIEATNNVPVEVASIADLKEATKNLEDNAISENAYKLGAVYVTLRTADKIFAQNGTEGMSFVSANDQANLAGFNYKYGDVVNALQGKVSKNGVDYTMYLDPTSYPVSTMNLPFLIPSTSVSVNDLATTKNILVEVDEAIVENTATRSTGLSVGGLNLVTDEVMNSDPDSDTIVPNAAFKLKGVSDGHNFYVYSSELLHTVGVETVNSNTEIEAIYSVSGMKKATLTEGINIVRMSDGSVRKVVIKK